MIRRFDKFECKIKNRGIERSELIHPWHKYDLYDLRRDINGRLLHARSTSFANTEMLIKLRKFISVSFDDFRE